MKALPLNKVELLDDNNEVVKQNGKPLYERDNGTALKNLIEAMNTAGKTLKDLSVLSKILARIKGVIRENEHALKQFTAEIDGQLCFLLPEEHITILKSHIEKLKDTEVRIGGSVWLNLFGDLEEAVDYEETKKEKAE